MVHGFLTLCFALIAAGAATAIWAMLMEYRTPIAVALGVRAPDPVSRAIGHRVRVRSVRPVMVERAPSRRAA